jgi:hypothetical protein
MYNERSRIEKVNRIAAIRREVAELEAEVMATRGDSSPARAVANQQLVVKLDRLDQERRDLERILWAERPPFIAEALRDLSGWIAANEFKLPKDTTASSLEGEIEWDVLVNGRANPRSEALLKRYREWQGIYAEAVALVHRIERSAYSALPDAAIQSELRREYRRVTASVKPGFFSSAVDAVKEVF